MNSYTELAFGVETQKRGLFVKRESNAKTISTIQWFDKYGYNAYVDLKTGEIKQAKE